MTQQFSSEGLAFSSDAMREANKQTLEGADEQWLEQDIHARIQGQPARVSKPVRQSRLKRGK